MSKSIEEKPLDLSAVGRGLDRDAGSPAVARIRKVLCGHCHRFTTVPRGPQLDLYIALARAVLAERVAQAAIDELTDCRIYPHDELYQARDAAHAAVDAALAALAVGE